VTADWTPEAALARRRIAIIVNAKSRRGRALFDAAVAGLTARGFTVTAAHAVRHPRHMGRVLGETIAAGHDVIAIGGGDGSLAHAAGRMAKRPLLMAILPLGTANSFARSLGITPELEPALDVIAHGDIARVDVARLGDSFFLNSATIGVPGKIAEDIPLGLKRWFGRIGYLLYGLVKFLRMEPFQVRIARTGQPDIVEKVVEVRIGNGSFIGGLKVVDSADPESRDVVIQLIRGRYRAALAGAWAANLAGWQQPKGRVREIRATAFSIACTPEQSISVDGETGQRTPVLVTVAAGALAVVVPKGSSAATRAAV
jgi:YegS/Rv2252/BmrU family lipid kinase